MRVAPLVAGLIGVAAIVGLTACSGPDASTVSGSPSPASRSSSTAEAHPTSSPSASISASVQAAYARFDAANRKLAAANSDATDAQIVGALTGAGFTTSQMQITSDATTIDRRVDSIEVSVLVDKTCLIGEYRGSAYSSVTAPVLASGKCLVGTTAAIG